MSLPNRLDSANRITTAIRFDPELHECLRLAAEEREVSMNFLVVKATADFLERLIPVEEMRWTHDRS